MINGLYARARSMVSQMRDDYSLSAVVTGFVATMVSYAGPLLIVFQAAKAANLSNSLLSSWIWAISIGSGLTGIILSIWFKAPVITAWSTPGVVLLVSGWARYPYSDAIGAFLLSAVIITILGMSGLFTSLMKRIPPSVTTAMLAGILLKFGVDVFVAVNQSPVLGLPMVLCYLAFRRWFPRYAVVATLTVGLLLAAGLGRLHVVPVDFSLVHPVFTAPTFSLDALIGISIPLCIVTMTSQNAPGLSVLRAEGYQTPASPLVAVTGIASALLAPFGSHGINLAAITAAICTGKEAHADTAKRYIAGIACGCFYLMFGMLGMTITSVFSAFPKELVAVIAGVALFASLGSSLSSAMEGGQKESALLTFLVTASGISIAGIGSAFWGLIAGVLTNWMLSGDIRSLLPRKASQPAVQERRP